MIEGSWLTLESHARAWSSSPALPCRPPGLSPILHRGQVLPIWCGYIPSAIALTAITTINAYLVKMGSCSGGALEGQLQEFCEKKISRQVSSREACHLY